MTTKYEPKYKVGDRVKGLRNKSNIYIIITHIDRTLGEYHYTCFNKDEEPWSNTFNCQKFDVKVKPLTKLEQALL